MAAAIGNQYATRGRIWREAIKRALARHTMQSVDAGLDKAADRLVKLALDDGDKWALDHIADRIDGKAPQSIALSGDEEGGPIRNNLKVEFVSAVSGEVEAAIPASKV